MNSKQRLKMFLFMEQQGKCFMCGHPISIKPGKTSIDHLVPKSKGGLNNAGNLVLMHKACNAMKGNRCPTSEELTRAYMLKKKKPRVKLKPRFKRILT